jgi:heme/copper-type cytochrome/quinol oxidase subunit 2
MLTIVLTTLFAMIVLAGVIVYYRRISGARKEERDFKSDGQLHMIYPES